MKLSGKKEMHPPEAGLEQEMRNLTSKLKNMWRKLAPRGDMKLLI